MDLREVYTIVITGRPQKRMSNIKSTRMLCGIDGGDTDVCEYGLHSFT